MLILGHDTSWNVFIKIAALAITCFVVQTLSLIFASLELWSGMESGTICCARIFDHPVNVTLYVRFGQWVALAFSVLRFLYDRF